MFVGLSVVSFFEIGMYSTVYLYRNYKEELATSFKVDSFSRRAVNIDAKLIQQKVLNDLQVKTLEKY